MLQELRLATYTFASASWRAGGCQSQSTLTSHTCSASPPHACRRYRMLFSLPPVAEADSSTMRGLIVLILTLHGVLRWWRWYCWNHDIRAYSLSLETEACHVIYEACVACVKWQDGACRYSYRCRYVQYRLL